MELLNKLNEHGSKMVKIIITGFPSIASDKDADAFLVKPVKPQELLSILDSKLKQN